MTQEGRVPHRPMGVSFWSPSDVGVLRSDEVLDYDETNHHRGSTWVTSTTGVGRSGRASRRAREWTSWTT